MKYFEFKAERGNIFIGKILKSWNKVLLKYEREVDDLPYYYIERTNVGHLSTAAYRLGAVTLEEYSSEKGKGKGKYSGRADLWIQTPSEVTYSIEAKQAWASINAKSVSTTINRLIRLIKKDVMKLTEQSNYMVGISFVVPYLTAGNKYDIEQFKAQILNLGSHSGDFAAVHFAKEQKWKQYKTDHKYYPGIAMVGKYFD